MPPSDQVGSVHGLPTWQDVKRDYPDLAEALRRDRNDYDAIVQWTALALGASIVLGKDEPDDRPAAGAGLSENASPG